MPKVHVYSAGIPSEDAALAYTEEMYDDDGDASSAFWDAIGADWLDHDCVETIYGTERFAYLASLLVSPGEAETVRERSRAPDNTLLLVFVVGEENASFSPRQTPEPLYLGTFEVDLTSGGADSEGESADIWQTIFVGPPWEAELHRVLLTEVGFRCFIPDAETKVMDPFVTGLDPLASKLQVRSGDAERARSFLESRPHEERIPVETLEALAMGGGAEVDIANTAVRQPERDSTEDEESEDEWTQDDMDQLSRRTRWSAVLTILYPLALFYGFVYLAASRESGLRAPAHRLTLFAFGLAVLYTIITVVMVVWL